MEATAKTWKFLKCTAVYRRIINMFKRSSKIREYKKYDLNIYAIFSVKL